MGSRGFLWVRLWEVKILWVRISMGVTLVCISDVGGLGEIFKQGLLAFSKRV